jgi:IS30 family transposase
MEQPKGHTYMSNSEKEMIREYRRQQYSLSQIAKIMKRSQSSIKRVVYDW